MSDLLNDLLLQSCQGLVGLEELVDHPQPREQGYLMSTSRTGCTANLVDSLRQVVGQRMDILGLVLRSQVQSMSRKFDCDRFFQRLLRCYLSYC